MPGISFQAVCSRTSSIARRRTPRRVDGKASLRFMGQEGLAIASQARPSASSDKRVSVEAPRSRNLPHNTGMTSAQASAAFISESASRWRRLKYTGALRCGSWQYSQALPLMQRPAKKHAGPRTQVGMRGAPGVGLRSDLDRAHAHRLGGLGCQNLQPFALPGGPEVAELVA